MYLLKLFGIVLSFLFLTAVNVYVAFYLYIIFVEGVQVEWIAGANVIILFVGWFVFEWFVFVCIAILFNALSMEY